MTWYKLYGHYKNQTQIQVVSDCNTFRALAKSLTQPSDAVLEIGCSTGETTKLLAQRAKHVLAVDSSHATMEDAHKTCAGFDNIEFLRIDTRDITKLIERQFKPDLMFVDIGGDALLGNIHSVMRLLLQHFQPRCWVVRNIELAIFNHLIVAAELPEESRELKDALYPKTDQHIAHLIELSHSDVTGDRLFAARKLRAINSPLARSRLYEMRDDSSVQIKKIAMLAV